MTEDRLVEISLELQGTEGTLRSDRPIDSGFSNIAIDLDSSSIDLYWKGQLPSSKARLIEDLQSEVPVRLHPAQYSIADFERALPQLWNSYPSAGMISFNTDGSGATVRLGPAALDRESPKSGFAVTEIAADEVIPAVNTRQNDAPPWSAGARIRSHSCSTGFGVVYGSTKYLLTAAHCGSNGQTATDGASQTIGKTAHERTAVDAMLITVSSLSGYSFDGAWNNSAGYRKPVKGRGVAVVGRTVCGSGSYTGVHCGLKVTNVNATFNWGEGVISGATADHPSGGIAVGQGDSGGPVFTLKDGDSSRIMATGLISGLSGTVSCGGLPSPNCGKQLLFVPMDRIVNYYPLSLWTA